MSKPIVLQSMIKAETFNVCVVRCRGVLCQAQFVAHIQPIREVNGAAIVDKALANAGWGEVDKQPLCPCCLEDLAYDQDAGIELARAVADALRRQAALQRVEVRG